MRVTCWQAMNDAKMSTEHPILTKYYYLWRQLIAYR